MENKRCIVLGGNGFIGSNLLRYLSSRDYKLISFDRYIPENKINNVDYIAGDFEDDQILLDAIKGQDIIIHLISTTNPKKSMDTPYSGYNIDIVQTIKILEYIKGSSTKILFASSGGTVYGEPEQCPITEDHDLNPICHYGIVKMTIEKILNMYNRVYKMNNIIMRISNPYGPGQDYTKGVGVIDAVIKNGLNDEIITIWGDGKNIRDYIYIDDLCEAVYKIIEYKGTERIFNVGNGQGYSINEIVNIVGKIIDKNIIVKYEPERKNDIRHIYLDTSKIKQETNFATQMNIEKGIGTYVNIIKENLK